MFGIIISFIVLIFTSSVTWPVTLWAGKKGARPEMSGLMISSMCFLVELVITIFQNNWHVFTWELIGLGATMGFAYAVGFCILIFTCLQIGPPGLTTMLNNLGVIGAIIVGIILGRRTTKDMILIGMGMVLMVGSLMLIKSEQGKDGRITKKWFVYVIIGSLFSVISFMANATMGMKYSNYPMQTALATNGTSTLILLVYSLVKKRGLPNRFEVINGLVYALVGIAGGYSTYGLLKYISPVLVYTVSVIAPIIVMQFCGYFFLKERLTKKNLLGMVLGIGGIIAFSLYNT